MAKLLTPILLCLGLLQQFDLNGQQAQLLETFPVNATVVGVLEDDYRLAILRIDRVDSSASHPLQKGDEILTEFYFTTRPVKNESKLKGIAAGDKISVRLHARPSPYSQDWQYTAFHYLVLPKEERAN